MPIHYINITKEELLKEYKRIHHHTTIDRFTSMLNTNKLTFVNPASWNDPFEKFFYERDYILSGKKIQLPVRDRLFALCFTGTSSSEAFWKVYSPLEDGIRLTFKTEDFINIFLDKIYNVEIYIGKVNYKSTKEFFELDAIKQELISELKESSIGKSQIDLMIQKRKAFEYENELRIMIIPKEQKTSKKLSIRADIRDFTQNYSLDPRIGKNQSKLFKEFFKIQFQIKLSQATLYNEIKRGPIILD